MQYNLLGKTGLNVSRLSFGASSLGAVFHPVDESQAIAAVHAALDCGINYFDVAPAYGGTLSETVLGKALRGIARDRFFLSTKVGKYTEPGGYGNDRAPASALRLMRAPGGWVWSTSISSTFTISNTRIESTQSGR
jgi:aryl-alcohol dehydrogenase-like predicted oxidoreductase